MRDIGTGYTFNEVLKAIRQMKENGQKVDFEYCVYNMPTPQAQSICDMLKRLGYDCEIGHRLGSENTLRINEKE